MTPPAPHAGAVGDPRLDPGADCPRCPRLVEMRARNRAAEPDWHNAPVPAFGALEARLLILGLAPGLRGANRTGRPFTGDYAGDLLYASLKRNGFARGEFERRRDDSLELIDCRVTNAVRCVPPENKPVPAEIKTCNSFLATEIAAMPRLKAVLALGGIAHDALLAAAGEKRSAYRFGHGAVHRLSGGLILADSYHCSRLNTNTGRLTEAMFDAVVANLKTEIDRA
jgi:uracil-DNA glycosylase family 4